MDEEALDMLQEFSKMYSFVTGVVEQLSLTLVSFDKMYLQDTAIKSTENMVVHILTDVANKHKHQLDTLSKCLLDEVERDREGHLVDKARISQISTLLKSIGYFEADFKKLFTTYAEDYYKRFLSVQLPISNLVDYTAAVSKQISEEKIRCESLFDESLAQMLYFLMKRILVDDIIGEILNSNFEKLILESRTKEIGFYYDLMKGNDSFETFLSFFESFVRNRSEAIVTGGEVVIETILNFHSDISNILHTVYAEDMKIKAAFDRAFESVIVKSDQHFATIFSNFVSGKMEKSSMTRDEVLKTIGDVMCLFKFIQNKKVFIQKYNQR